MINEEKASKMLNEGKSLVCFDIFMLITMIINVDWKKFSLWMYANGWEKVDDITFSKALETIMKSKTVFAKVD